MQMVATNIRFPKQDYEDLRTLAFQEKTSLASLINTAVKEYKFKKLAVSRKNRIRLFETMKNSRIKINVSTVDLVHEGRKYE